MRVRFPSPALGIFAGHRAFLPLGPTSVGGLCRTRVTECVPSRAPTWARRSPREGRHAPPTQAAPCQLRQPQPAALRAATEPATPARTGCAAAPRSRSPPRPPPRTGSPVRGGHVPRPVDRAGAQAGDPGRGPGRLAGLLSRPAAHDAGAVPAARSAVAAHRSRRGRPRPARHGCHHTRARPPLVRRAGHRHARRNGAAGSHDLERGRGRPGVGAYGRPAGRCHRAPALRCAKGLGGRGTARSGPRPPARTTGGPHRARPDLPAAARRAQHRRPRRHHRHQSLPHRQRRARPCRRATSRHGATGRDHRRRDARSLPGGGSRGRLVGPARR